MTLTQVHGRHTPNGDEAITLEDLYQLLKSIPARVRRNNYPSINGPEPECKRADLMGISFGQSDQAEKYEFHTNFIVSNWY